MILTQRLRVLRIVVACKHDHFVRQQARKRFSQGEQLKRVKSLSSELRRSSRKKLLMIHIAQKVLDLRVPPGNRLEKLKGDRAQEYSIRINDQWRITFKFKAGNASNVCVEDYHS